MICDILGSFELNSQVSQHISTIRVLSALTISSLAPVLAKLGKNVKSMKIMGVEELLDVRLRTSPHTAFGFVSLPDECHWDIGIE